MVSRGRYICGCCLSLVLVAGCQSSVDEAAIEPMPAVAAEAAPTSTPAAAIAEPVQASGTEPAPTSQQIAANAFTPPFPDRKDLFEPPKRAQSTVRRDEESGKTVELKGFINVAGPRAVLSIDGVITPIAEGDEKYGVQVISIDGPTVVLQRGRSRWTATLE